MKKKFFILLFILITNLVFFISISNLFYKYHHENYHYRKIIDNTEYSIGWNNENDIYESYDEALTNSILETDKFFGYKFHQIGVKKWNNIYLSFIMPLEEYNKNYLKVSIIKENDGKFTYDTLSCSLFPDKVSCADIFDLSCYLNNSYKLDSNNELYYSVFKIDDNSCKIIHNNNNPIVYKNIYIFFDENQEILLEQVFQR